MKRLTDDEFGEALHLSDLGFHTLIAAAHRAGDSSQRIRLADAFPALDDPESPVWRDAEVFPPGRPFRALLAAAYVRAGSDGRRRLHDVDPALCADVADWLDAHARETGR